MDERIRKAMREKWNLTDEELDKALEEGRIYPSAMHVEYEEQDGVEITETVVPLRRYDG